LANCSVGAQQLDARIFAMPGCGFFDFATVNMPRAQLIAAPQVEAWVDDDGRIAAAISSAELRCCGSDQEQCKDWFAHNVL